MSGSGAIVRSWRVGRYTVTLSMSRPELDTAIQLVCEWAPCLPTNLTRAELRQYQRGRDAAVAGMTEEMLDEAHRQRLSLVPDPLESAPDGVPLH